MQLLAKNRQQKMIHAEDAQKHEEYNCLECRGLVRVRGGSQRRKHFYHLTPNRTCYLNCKSLIHIQTQCSIQKLFPEGDIILERRFASIQRIADVCWEKEKIIFEIQCSYISGVEIAARNRDYASLGYQVVWILHDHRYNANHMTDAEMYLLEHPHYFTNIDAQGKGIIYDQIAWMASNSQRKKGGFVPVDVASVHKKIYSKGHFKLLRLRETYWPLYFSGDLLDCSYRNLLSEEQKKDLQNKLQLQKRSRWHIFYRFIEKFKTTYQNILNVVLESSCK